MIFRRILAVASQTVKQAVRSRALSSLTLLLIAVLLSIPFLIRGDGTLAGRLQIVIEYSLAAAMTLLSVTTLWAAAGTVATEIEERPLFLVLSKPVSRLELWAGKWMAIVGLDAILLALTGGIVAAMVFHIVHSAPPGSPERESVVRDLLTAREATSPDLSTLTRAPAAEAEEAAADETTDEEDAPAAAPAAPDRHAILAACTVAPNRSLSLVFAPRALAPAAGLSLAFKFASSRPERVPVLCAWTFTGADGRTTVIATTNTPGLRYTLPVPSPAIVDGKLNVTFSNLGGRIPSTVVFDPTAGGLELLVPQGGFLGNLSKGLMIALLRLSLIAAIGVSAGCLLSVPVAVFLSLFVLILLASSGYVQHVSATGVFYVPHEGPMPEQGLPDRLTLRLFEAINAVTAPLLDLDGLPLLERGRWIGGALVGQAAKVLLLYTAVVAAVGVLLFQRREIGRA